MPWAKAAELPVKGNYQELDQYLTQQKIHHRFVEQANTQVFFVYYDHHPQEIHLDIEQIHQYLEGQQTLSSEPLRAQYQGDTPEELLQSPSSFLGAISQYPVTLALIVLGVLGWGIHVLFPGSVLESRMLFSAPLSVVSNSELWRLFSPAFLHFSFFHILFNGLWIWEFGRRLEVYLGSWVYFIGFLGIAFASNYIQYLWGSSVYFGGLSGVVYGFLGFLWVANRHVDNPKLQIAPGIYGVMLIFLLIGVFGIIDVFINGKVANGAHCGGLVAGLAAGGLYFKTFNVFWRH